MSARYTNKRVLVSRADRYMGPPIAKAFRDEGAEVIENTQLLQDQAEVDALVESVGEVDILVANFAESAFKDRLENIKDDDWFTLFDVLVHPFMRLIRAFGPQMKARGQGKIVAVTSASSLRGIPGCSAYCAARGAQNAFVRAVGLELAPFNVQVNAIAQNYVSNDTYYPPGIEDNPKFIAHLKAEVPTQKVAAAHETAELALFLASPNNSHMVGQVVPWAGGWATTTG